jgi:hypothetical protein
LLFYFVLPDMDVLDVSNHGGLVALLKQPLSAAEQASQRKGQIAQDHGIPGYLISDFMIKRMAFVLHSTHMAGILVTTKIPASYPPCIRSVRELKPVMISEMRLETHHRGTSILLRVLTP